MLQFIQLPAHSTPGRRRARTGQRGDQPLEARVKRECADLYPGVDPVVWYQVVLDGEFEGDLEGFWIDVKDWVTYVLARHFDLQARRELH